MTTSAQFATSPHVAVGLDRGLGLSWDQYRELGRHAARLGYQSVWTNAANEGMPAGSQAPNQRGYGRRPSSRIHQSVRDADAVEQVLRLKEDHQQ